MKIVEKKNGESINISKAILKTNFASPLGEGHKPEVYKRTRMYQEVFTDGTIVKENDKETKSITQFSVEGRDYDATSLSTREVFLNDFNYIIVFTFVNEGMHVGNSMGFFDVLRDVNVYVNDLNDKKTLKALNKAIRSVEKNYLVTAKNSLSIFTKDYCVKEEKIAPNVYKIKKSK